MAEPTRHQDPVAQTFTRILSGSNSPCFLLVHRNIAIISEYPCTKYFVDLVSARMMKFNIECLMWRAEPLINHYLLERALYGNARTPDAPIPIEDVYACRKSFTTTHLNLGSVQGAHYDEFYYFLDGLELGSQTLRKIKTNLRGGAIEFRLPPELSAICHPALTTVKIPSTKKPADIRDVIVFCGGSVILKGQEDNMYRRNVPVMPFDNLLIFDINRETFERWPTLPDPIHGFPAGREEAAAVIAAEKWMFVIGGSMRDKGGDRRSVWRLDLAASRWQRLFQLPATVHRFQMGIFRVAVPYLAWVSFEKVLSLLKPEAFAAVHARFGFGIPGPSVNVAEATKRIMDILFAD